ncbi:YfmQ family protein [Yersinia artesiana]|nr:YfmQ family protein [Yersinia artesiana]
MGIIPTSKVESIICRYHTHQKLYAENTEKGDHTDRL